MEALADFGRQIVRALTTVSRALDTFARWTQNPRAVVGLWRAVRESLAGLLACVSVEPLTASRAPYAATYGRARGSGESELERRQRATSPRGPCFVTRSSVSTRVETVGSR